MTKNLNKNRSTLEKIKDNLISTLEASAHLPRILFNLRVEISVFRGKIRGSDEWARMLYVGRGRNRAYLKGKLLTDAEEVFAKTTSLLSYRSEMKRMEREVDFVFVDIGMPYHWYLCRSGEYLVMPDWIDMFIPIEGDWDRVESSFNKTTRKQIRRNPYGYEVSNDPEVITQFYDEYYLPYLTLRHEDATVEPRQAIERRARQGGILRVIGDDGPVVAGVVYPEDGVLYYLWLGMPERYLENQPEGALFASYYFCLRYAFENTFREVNWMGTRSFPTDGVFQFKRKWGVHVEDMFSPDAILFKPASNNHKAIAFAETCPLMARRDGKLEQVFCSTAETIGDTDIRRMISGYACEGIDQITIAHVRDKFLEPEVTVSEAYPNVRIIAVNASQFASLYAGTLLK